MKEGREVGRRPRKRTERVLSLTSDSDEHFLAARALGLRPVPTLLLHGYRYE